MILPEMRKNIPVSYKILSSSFLPGLHEQELKQLVKQNHSALEDGLKQEKTGLYQPFAVSNA